MFGSIVLFDVLRLIAHVHFKILMNQVYAAAWSAMTSNRYINPLHPIAAKCARDVPFWTWG